MKKLSLYVFLLLMFCNVGFAGDAIDMIFGVKLNEDVSEYAKIEDGRKDVNVPNTYVFWDEDLTLDRDLEFEKYYLRTDENFKVINVSGYVGKSVSFDNFKNQCLIDRNKVISDIAKDLNIDQNKFENHYRKNDLAKETITVNGEKVKYLWHDSNYSYEDNGQKFRLMIYCGYWKKDENLIIDLMLSWFSEDYYRKYVLPRFEIIEPFNLNFMCNLFLFTLLLGKLKNVTQLFEINLFRSRSFASSQPFCCSSALLYLTPEKTWG